MLGDRDSPLKPEQPIAVLGALWNLPLLDWVPLPMPILDLVEIQAP